MQGFLLAKPDYVENIEEIMQVTRRFIRNRELPLLLEKSEVIPNASNVLVRELYWPQRNVSHFEKVIDYLTGQPIGVIWILGKGGVEVSKTLMELVGEESDPYKCSPGELRYELKHLIPYLYQNDANQRKLRNILHRSDSPSALQREIKVVRKMLGI